MWELAEEVGEEVERGERGEERGSEDVTLGHMYHLTPGRPAVTVPPTFPDHQPS